ncbi:MAG TPA: PQQ-dependent sugar dehydrogenase, partial [Tepidisphaeraceae bacterium]|nr:PQQ-dependent sugar dehydrogenase [Tepidisphaeraceae bacterium]
HNGGAIHFGPDGKLYIGVGENGNGNNAQSLTTDLGKMLRINADGSIPTDNPFYGNTTGNNRAIWALGLRNPFTFAFQPASGRMFIDDVGQDTWEEIDDGIAGSNYGWPVTEGPTTDPRFRGPLFAYPHGPNDSTGVAITGGTFCDPPVSPFGAVFNGTYFFADLGVGFIHNFNPATNAETPFATGYQNPVDLKVDAQGNLFVLTIGDGAVHRISATLTTLPTPTIVRPLAAQHFVAGRRFGFIGVATDAQDGRLKPSALSWDVQLWRDGVEQRSVKQIAGRAIGFYDVPRVGEETGGSADVFYRIVLTGTNSRGQSATTVHDITPLTGTIHLLSRVGPTRADGLQIAFDGQPEPTPFDFTGVVGSIHTIDAISPQTFDDETIIPLRFPNHRLVIVRLGQATFVAPFRAAK